MILLLSSFSSSFFFPINNTKNNIENIKIQKYNITPNCKDLKLCERAAYDLANSFEAFSIVDLVYKELNSLYVYKSIRMIVGGKGECKPLGNSRKNRKRKSLSCFNLDENHVLKVLLIERNTYKFFRTFHNYIHKYYHFNAETINFEKTILLKAGLTKIVLKSILKKTLTKLVKLANVFEKVLSSMDVSIFSVKDIDSVYTVYPIGKNSKLNMLKNNSINLKVTSKTALVTSSRSDYRVNKYKNQMLDPKEYAMFKININNNCKFKKIPFNDSDYSKYVSKGENRYVSKPYSHFKVIGYKVVDNINYFILECILEQEIGTYNETYTESIYSR